MKGPSITGDQLLTQAGNNFNDYMCLQVNGQKFKCKVKGKYGGLRKGTITIADLGRVTQNF